MQDKFKIYYEPMETDFKDLWNNAIFIFDTNSILNLFKYPKTVREDFIKIIEKIQDRVWIPHQVALEYHENKQTVKSDQIKKYSEVNRLIDKLKTDVNEALIIFKNDINSLDLKRKHLDINPELVTEKISNTIESLNNQLDIYKKFEYSNDKKVEEEKIIEEFKKLELFINNTFTNKVGECPADQGVLDKYYVEAQKRYSLLIPPGFQDLEKSKDKNKRVYMYKGLMFKREYGDFILWKEIIIKSQETSCQYLIFVTDDNKEDWWEKQGSKNIGGRKELFDEIYFHAHQNFKMFYMYNSWRFMTYAKELLKIEVEKSSIEQVRLFEEIQGNISNKILRAGLFAEREFIKWVKLQYPYDEIITDLNRFDCIRIDSKTKNSIAYEVKLFTHDNVRQIKMRLKDTFRRYSEELLDKIDSLVFVLVSYNSIELNNATILASGLKAEFPGWCTYLFANVQEVGDELNFKIT